MFTALKLVCNIVVLFSFIHLVSSENSTEIEYTTVTEDESSRTSLPSLGCFHKYQKTVGFQKEVPPRTYGYFHEEQDLNDIPLKFRIVGGNQIDIESAPYSVLYGPYCGGSLIAPDWVLTAAHCEDRYDFILAGATSSIESLRYPICAHFFHPGWSKPSKTNFHDWDFQLVLLEIPVPVTPRSMPIAIGRDTDIQAGEYVAVSGWGYIRAKQRAMEDILRQVMVPIIPQDDCTAIPNEFYKTVTPRMFCAGYDLGEMDACQGDSGGPAVYNNHLIGLVSYGVGCAEAGHPGVYSRVPMARPWIRQITGLPL